MNEETPAAAEDAQQPATERAVPMNRRQRRKLKKLIQLKETRERMKREGRGR